MGYKVLIPTAGTGSRLGELTKYINKSLVSIGNKPTISRIIEMFPGDCEFVIPTGHKANLVKEFLGLAYPERKFYFTDVYPFEGEGSGLGLSVLTCKDLLQEPFVFCSCDTIVVETIPEPYQNWMGYGEREKLKEYRTIGINKKRSVTGIFEKGTFQDEVVKPYIGLAGIYDYKVFWETMEGGRTIAVGQGESFGLAELVMQKKVKSCGFTWYDTGVQQELEETRRYFQDKNAPNILPKMDEDIWFMDDQVIKFSDNTKFISERVKRAELLKEYVPKISGSVMHMYSYDYVPGKVMSACVNSRNFKKLLDFSQDFWKKAYLAEAKQKEFSQNCKNFYYDKTLQRVQMFYDKFQKIDIAETINGEEVPRLNTLLDKIDWEWIFSGIPGQFHGDYHFENILYNEQTDEFCFLDWRQNFGTSLEIGDIYYDLGKLLHGLIICHELISDDQYKIEWNNNVVNYDFHRKESLVECEQYFYFWLEKMNYEVRKVKIITALIYLNIAALHHYPYGLLLYALGKKMLYETIDEE